MSKRSAGALRGGPFAQPDDDSPRVAVDFHHTFDLFASLGDVGLIHIASIHRLEGYVGGGGVVILARAHGENIYFLLKDSW